MASWLRDKISPPASTSPRVVGETGRQKSMDAATPDVSLLPWSEMTAAQALDYVKTEVLLGVIICFAQVPESVAFAFLAHLAPPIALHSAWIVGLICSIFGGRPGMINGATGAFAAIIATFIPAPTTPGASGQGVELLFPSVMLAGVLMGVIWLVRGAKYITMIPESVMVGFCNGLAIVIGNAQLHPFQEGHGEHRHWKSGSELGFMVLIMLVSMGVMEFLPKLPCQLSRLVPSSLISILAAVAIEQAIRASGFRTDTIGDVAQFTEDNIAPIPFFLDAQYDLGLLSAPGAVGTIVLQGVMLCLVGVIESLMTTEVVTALVKTPANSSAVVWSMGLANVVSGFLGGMGGNAMIGLSTINGLNGGKGRIAPMVTALGIMICIVGAYPLLNLIPVSALAGIMIVVVLHTFRWDSVLYLVAALVPRVEWRRRARVGPLKLPVDVDLWDALIIAVVTVVTVVTNLVYAVFAGVVLAALRFAWATSQRLEVDSALRPDGTKVYTVRGDLFFATAMRFHLWFTPDEDPERVELIVPGDVEDYSAAVALEKVRAMYQRSGRIIAVTVQETPLQAQRQQKQKHQAWISDDERGEN